MGFCGIIECCYYSNGLIFFNVLPRQRIWFFITFLGFLYMPLSSGIWILLICMGLIHMIRIKIAWRFWLKLQRCCIKRSTRQVKLYFLVSLSVHFYYNCHFFHFIQGLITRENYYFSNYLLKWQITKTNITLINGINGITKSNNKPQKWTWCISPDQ